MIQKKKFSDAIAANISVVGGLVENLPKISISLKKGFCKNYWFSSGDTYKYTCISEDFKDLAIIFLNYTTSDAGAIYMIQRGPGNYFVKEVYRKALITSDSFPNYEITDSGVIINGKSGYCNVYVMFFAENINNSYTFERVS